MCRAVISSVRGSNQLSRWAAYICVRNVGKACAICCASFRRNWYPVYSVRTGQNWPLLGSFQSYWRAQNSSSSASVYQGVLTFVIMTVVDVCRAVDVGYRTSRFTEYFFRGRRLISLRSITFPYRSNELVVCEAKLNYFGCEFSLHPNSSACQLA